MGTYNIGWATMVITRCRVLLTLLTSTHEPASTAAWGRVIRRLRGCHKQSRSSYEFPGFGIRPASVADVRHSRGSSMRRRACLTRRLLLGSCSALCGKEGLHMTGANQSMDECYQKKPEARNPKP